tara:strand:- start:545 stop:1099 length:555 start_codon:yes stop_codon:yes gene_type:complete
MTKIAYKLDSQGKISQLLDINSITCSQEGVVIASDTNKLYQEYLKIQETDILYNSKVALVNAFKEKYDQTKRNITINITEGNIIRKVNTSLKPEKIIGYLNNIIDRNIYPSLIAINGNITQETITSQEFAIDLISKLQPYITSKYKLQYWERNYNKIYGDIINCITQEELNVIDIHNTPTIIIN